MIKQRFPDTPEMIKASTFTPTSNLDSVRARVYDLLDSLDKTNSVELKINYCMCLEPYGIYMEGTHSGPTELEYVEHVNSIKTYIDDEILRETLE